MFQEFRKPKNLDCKLKLTQDNVKAGDMVDFSFYLLFRNSIEQYQLMLCSFDKRERPVWEDDWSFKREANGLNKPVAFSCDSPLSSNRPGRYRAELVWRAVPGDDPVVMDAIEFTVI